MSPSPLQCDAIVVGAGMAGASAAYALARRRSVVVVERESQPGYHSTGRSAALYVQTYGSPAMRAMTVAGRDSMLRPPDGFGEHPLVTPRGALFGGADSQMSRTRALYDECRELSPVIRLVGREEIDALCPVLRPGTFVHAVYDPDAMDIDVDAMLQGFLRAARRMGARLELGAGVEAIERSGSQWLVRTREAAWRAPIVVNAAGAWADAVVTLAGGFPLGLQPLRRTALTVDPPAGLNIARWSAVFDIDEQWYFKPEAGRIMVSPADETPSAPCDAQPDEYDVAVAADRLESATTIAVPRIVSKWAGLRCFVSDHAPVVGPDPQLEGFFWLAAQGGAGIQTAFGASVALASLVESGDVPATLRDLGLTAAMLSPARLRE